ncbi:MAG: hypothetical protein LBL01_04245 [Bifidobacteriaceae bacterium]|nr:hypothetical protein [Bifidobacteriaceae bacterium]
MPGAKVDISAHGGGAQITPAMEAARLAQAEGRAAIEGDFELDDSVMYALIDAGRR